jgi:hypothetical protein
VEVQVVVQAIWVWMVELLRAWAKYPQVRELTGYPGTGGDVLARESLRMRLCEELGRGLAKVDDLRLRAYPQPLVLDFIQIDAVLIGHVVERVQCRLRLLSFLLVPEY